MASDSETSTYSDLTSVKSDAMGEPIVKEVDLEVVMSDTSSSTCATTGAKAMKSPTTEAKADANTPLSTPATTEAKAKKRKANPEATTEAKTKKIKSTPMTPMTPAPTTPIRPMTRRLSPTPSFGRHDDKREEATSRDDKPYDDRRDRAQSRDDTWLHSRNYSWWEPKMVQVGGKSVHEKAWWQLKRSCNWDTYYFTNSHGESIWPAAR